MILYILLTIQVLAQNFTVQGTSKNQTLSEAAY